MQQWLVSGQHPDAYLLLSHIVQVSENYGSKALEIYINVFCRWQGHYPVGESEKTISTNVWASGGALVPGDKILGALHHDFYICILVSSVTLKSDVPDNANDSFYKGTAFFAQTSGTTCKQLYKWVSIYMELVTIKTCSCNSNFNGC